MNSRLGPKPLAIEEVYFTALQEKSKQSKIKRTEACGGKYFSMSQYGGCLRRAVLERANVESLPQTVRNMSMFDVGDQIERAILRQVRNWAELNGVVMEQQGEVWTPDKQGKGHFDVYLTYPDFRTKLADIKSIKSDSLKFFPKENNRTQLGAYAWGKRAEGKSVDELELFYLARESHNAVFFCRTDHPDVDESIDKAKVWHEKALRAWDKYVATKELPPEEPCGLCRPKYCRLSRLHCPKARDKFKNEKEE